MILVLRISRMTACVNYLAVIFDLSWIGLSATLCAESRTTEVKLKNVDNDDARNVTIDLSASVSNQSVSLSLGEKFSYTLKGAQSTQGFSVQGMPYWMHRAGDCLVGQAIKSGNYSVKIHAISQSGVSAPYILNIFVQAASSLN